MSKFKLLLTLDYELNISSTPDVMENIIKPTEVLLEVCCSVGAKLTIMVEIGELWAFEKITNKGFAEQLGYDPAEIIRNQLVQAIKQGHDVQMHLHPQWLNAVWEQSWWKLDYAKYRLTDLNYFELVKLFQDGKAYLEGLLCCHSDDYECLGFRSGNWVTQPSNDYLRALHSAGLRSDTSVYKWGYTDTPSVFMDYRNAFSNVLPWMACWDDINQSSPTGRILEVPIYAEPVSLLGLLSVKRLRSASQYVREDRKIAQNVKPSTPQQRHLRVGLLNNFRKFFGIYPKKLDFCKLSWREMVRMIENVHRRYAEDPMVGHVPIVMIGHSKEPMSSAALRRFLKEVFTRYKDSISFSTYREFVQQYRSTAG